MLVDVCLTPALIQDHGPAPDLVVVADIYRATTCMCVAFQQGVKNIKPILSLEEGIGLKKDHNWIIAGERGGQKAEGFDLGNSPFEFLQFDLAEQNLAMTTTNGTRAIHSVSSQSKLLIGSFLNISAIATYCQETLRDNGQLLILCSGWQNKISLEDTLLAGALIEKLYSVADFKNDEPMLAYSFWKQSKSRLPETVRTFSHAERLMRLGFEKDLDFCLQQDITDLIPVYDHQNQLLSL